MTEKPKSRGPSIPSAFNPVDRSPIPGLTNETEDQTIPGNQAKVLYDRYPDLTGAELERLSILPPGTELEQGGVYFDLLRPGDGPFKALGGQQAAQGTLLIAKRDTDFENWNRIVEKDRQVETHPAIERPEREDHAVINQANLND